MNTSIGQGDAVSSTPWHYGMTALSPLRGRKRLKQQRKHQNKGRSKVSEVCPSIIHCPSPRVFLYALCLCFLMSLLVDMDQSGMGLQYRDHLGRLPQCKKEKSCSSSRVCSFFQIETYPCPCPCPCSLVLLLSLIPMLPLLS